MELYLILALSFAIMHWWSYTRQIVKTVQAVEKKLNLEYANLSPSRYTMRIFLLSFLLAPWYLSQIMTLPRWDYIKMKATEIVRKQYAIEISV